MRIATQCGVRLLAVLQLLWAPLATGLDLDKVHELAMAGLNQDPKLYAGKLAAATLSDRIKFLDIAYADPSDSDSDGGWNAKYDLQYASERGTKFSIDGGRATMESFGFGLDIKGSYAFDSATNADDLSTVNLKLSYIAGDWGELDIAGASASHSYQQCMLELSAPPDRAKFASDDAFDKAANDFGSGAELCSAQYGINQLGQSSSRPWVYAINFHAALEGDQDYSNTQVAYGLQGLLSARNLPSLRLDLERVDASNNDMRMAVTDDEEFDRISAELGYRYQLASINNYPVTFYADYRYFYEINAPQAVQRADMDEFGYFSAALRLPVAALGYTNSEDFNLFLRYTDGQLPFNIESQRAVEVGFSTNIGFLGALLSQ